MDSVTSETCGRRHRRHYTVKERQAILRRYRSAQLSQSQFASREGIALATFCRWLRLERDEDRKLPANPAVAPVEIGRLSSLSPEGPAWAEVVRPDGWRVRITGSYDPASLHQLLASLPPCST